MNKKIRRSNTRLGAMELYAGNSNNDALVETDTSHQQQNVLGKEPLERCTTAIFVTTDFASELSIGGCYQRRITSSRHSDPLFTKARSYYRGLSVDREQDRIAILGSSQYQASFAHDACRQRQLCLMEPCVVSCIHSTTVVKTRVSYTNIGRSFPPSVR